MRPNGNGVRYFKAHAPNGKLTYYWIPPKSLWKAGIFRFVTLGREFTTAIAEAKQWNKKLDAYYVSIRGRRPHLETVRPMSAAFIARSFEASFKFSKYSERTKEEYPRMYRRIEIFKSDGNRMFGDFHVSEITRQVVYSIYEHHVQHHGLENANRIMSAWQAAFKYATLKIPGVVLNPFTHLGMETSPPRRQRWTDSQLQAFIKKADELGYPSVGRCALMCIELVQRPGDILNLRWGDYRERLGAWHIRQSKRGAEVWVPPTERLRSVLNTERRRLLANRNSGEVRRLPVCPTKTGKRWQRRNFTKTARMIARAVGIPDDLQIRDLRRTAATEGASAGATPWEMMAVGGWQNQASIRPYFVGTPEQAASFQLKREAYRANQIQSLGVAPSDRNGGGR
jgi:integrase